jgi:hypothetical protein
VCGKSNVCFRNASSSENADMRTKQVFSVIVVAACGRQAPQASPAAPQAAVVAAQAPQAAVVAPDAPVETDTAVDATGLEVEVSVRLRSGRGIRSGDVIDTNEDFEIVVTLDHAAFVYVGGLNATREAYIVLPERDVSAELPAGTHRIPARADGWLFLKPPGGRETLLLVASRRPIVEVDRALAVMVGELAPAEEHAAPSPTLQKRRAVSGARRRRSTAPRTQLHWAPQPGRLAGATPRGELAVRYDSHVISAPDGLIVYALTFSHRAP